MRIITKLAAIASLSLGAYSVSTHSATLQSAPMEPNLIRNGVNVAEGNRQYQVYLELRNENGDEYGCGGAVIDPYWVLTAAHCVDEDKVVTSILGGSSDLESSNIQHLVPNGSFIHPDYVFEKDSTGNIARMEHDIALVRLKEPTNLPVLKLADQTMLTNYFASQNTAIASGWGLLQEVPPVTTEIMQQVVLEITSTNCSSPSNGIFDNICSFSDANGIQKGICVGDSGGPLTIDIDGQDYSIGVSSTGPESCGISFFTKVTKYLDWINETKKLRLFNHNLITSGWSVRDSEYCSAPYNHVITGIGGRMDSRSRITTLVLEVRALLSDSSLGPVKRTRCGTSPDHSLEKFVSLPDGYVMTGFAAHSRRNNFVGLTAQGKRFDSSTGKLVGDTISLSDGTEGAEVEYKPNTSVRLLRSVGFRAYNSNFRGFKTYTAAALGNDCTFQSIWGDLGTFVCE